MIRILMILNIIHLSRYVRVSSVKPSFRVGMNPHGWRGRGASFLDRICKCDQSNHLEESNGGGVEFVSLCYLLAYITIVRLPSPFTVDKK